MHVETETLFAYFFSFANGASSPSKQKNGWLESLSIFVLGNCITSSYLELIRIWTVFSHIWKTLINPPRLAANKRSPTILQMIQSDLFGMVSLRDLLKGLYMCPPTIGDQVGSRIESPSRWWLKPPRKICWSNWIIFLAKGVTLKPPKSNSKSSWE